MKISGEHHYDVPRDRLWEALLDPEVLSRTLPGCENLKQTAENEFSGKLKMKVGPVQGIFEGKVTLSEIDPRNGYRMKIEGRGAPGFVNGDGLLRLEEKDDRSTTLHYEIEAQVGGRIASVGQRLLDSSAKVITRQGLEGLARQVETPAPSESAPASAAGDPTGDTSPPAPSQAQFAGSFLAGLLGELVPRERRPLVIVAAVLVVLITIAVFLRTCGG